MKSLKVLFVMLTVSAFTLALVSFVPGKPWEVPKEYKTMKNPVKAGDEAIKAGKAKYSTTCKSCHGPKGLGDGPKSKTLKTPSGDFSVDLKGQADGELFYKTKTGRGDMPAYDKKVTDEDIWSIVHYLRTFAK
ncbi:MAG: cytochrome c [Bacteroidia bacterium]|nr:cytochrome c [Bacteroidia bacterium]